ncbi:MAG: hypothetical protein DME63_09670 [Verrucomicrobia bacterium]|nr:MAG: hypothetical protein DME63_09670 [Verrucomicrobiota bacterium]
MVFNRLGFVAVVLISFLLIGRLWSQEAVDLERSSRPAAETTPEPSTTPEKSATKETTSEKPTRGVEETMRPEEFKAAGLDKLSEDELQHLDAWLKGYRQTTQKKATEQAQAKATEEIKKATEKATEEANRTARTKLDTLVSRVDGSFDGIKGRTIIRLEDGTVWKQANVDDHFRAPATEHPTAVVLHTTFGYKMRVEGTQEFYVDPVVRP